MSISQGLPAIEVERLEKAFRGVNATKHRDFYDEYLAVMDLPAEFFLQTVDTVFVQHALPKGEMSHRGTPVDLRAIRETAILAVEGENDDISGVGQTRAALHLTPNLPDSRKAYWLQPKVGRYGVFNGSRFRAEVAPRIADFIRNAEFDRKRAKENPVLAPMVRSPRRQNGSRAAPLPPAV